MTHGIYISRPCDASIYVAERSRKGSRRLLWSVMPERSIIPERRIDASQVPTRIRRQAYRILKDVSGGAWRSVRV